MIAAAPFLRGALNFHGRGVRVEEAAERQLFIDEMLLDRAFSDEDVQFIRSHCREHDGAADSEYWNAPWRFSTTYYLLRDVEMLSHTGCLADMAGRGLITADGQPENWNRDKVAFLRRRSSVDGVALTVRRYTNYFHFMLEAAMPLVAYFEHEKKAEAAHSIVAAPIGPSFVRQTLKAIASRYGARFFELRPGEKIQLERAVGIVRASPCSDWPMARPETAAALRDALLAQFDRDLEIGANRSLYLRRGVTKIRNLRNADGLDSLLERHGFQMLEPASANLAEQVKFCAEADRIVAVHGAALANLLFARPGAEVIELFAEDFCKSVYMMLSRQLGLRHRRVVNGAGDFAQNFSVDLCEVDAALAG